ncbi:MAG: GldG family protein [Kiritimatiellae bacterium]|nr:GldG family protein [Kiritimatiellia bacterium]
MAVVSPTFCANIKVSAEDGSRWKFWIPEPDSDAEEWAQRYGLTASRLDPAGNLPPVFLGLVALSGAKQSSIPFFSPADEPQVEFLITRAVHDVTTAKKPKLAVISPLPIMGNAGMFMGQRPDPWIVINELRAVADVTDLSADIESVPEDIDTLLLVYPRNLPETTLYALDQFVLRGGHLFAMNDPLNLTELNLQSSELNDPNQTHADMNKLTSAWGVTMATDRVVADSRAATRISRPDGSTERHLAWLTLRPENFNKQEIATAALDMMQMPMAGWFQTNAVEGLTLTPLITAGLEAGSITVSEAISGIPMGDSSFRKEPGPMPIALRISGHFKTAFPDGRPKSGKPEQAPDTNSHTAQLKESNGDGVVILVADADFLYDSFAGRKLPMFGPGVYQLMNDNINFAANIAGQLVGGDALLGLRGRGTF